MLDHQDRLALVDQAPEHLQQLADVVKVQPGRRLVKDVELAGVGAGAFRENLRELEALRLAARQRRERLAELDVIEAHVDERLQDALDGAVPVKIIVGLLHGHLEHVGDAHGAAAEVVEFDLKHLGPVARAVAVRAAQQHVV